MLRPIASPPLATHGSPEDRPALPRSTVADDQAVAHMNHAALLADILEEMIPGAATDARNPPDFDRMRALLFLQMDELGRAARALEAGA